MPEIHATMACYGSVSFTQLKVCCSTQLVANCELFLDQHQSRSHSLPLLPVSISCSQGRINMQNIVPLLGHLQWQNSPWLLRAAYLNFKWRKRQNFFFPSDISGLPGSKTAHQSLISSIWLLDKILKQVQKSLDTFFIQSHLRESDLHVIVWAGFSFLSTLLRLMNLGQQRFFYVVFAKVHTNIKCFSFKVPPAAYKTLVAWMQGQGYMAGVLLFT